MKKTLLIAIVFLATGCTWFRHPAAPTVSTPSNTPTQSATDPYPTTVQGWKTYTDELVGFSFQYPDDWNSQAIAPSTNKDYHVPYLDAEFISPFCKQAGVACYQGNDLSIYHYPTVSDFTNQYEYQNGPAYKSLGDVMNDQNAEVHSTGSTTVDGNPAYFVSIGGNGTNDGVVFQRGNSVYELSFNTLQDNKVYTGATSNLESLVISTWRAPLVPSATLISPAATAGMPTMTYKIVNQTLNQGGNPTDSTIDLYANGNKVGTVDSVYEGPVVFFAGNQHEVLFTVQLDGIGDGASSNVDAYKLDLQSGTVTPLVGTDYVKDPLNIAQDFDATVDLSYLSYVTATLEKDGTTYDRVIQRMDTVTQATQSIPFAPAALAGTGYVIANVCTSPDQTKMAVAVNVPAPDFNDNRLYTTQIWIVNIQTGTATLYAKDDTQSPMWTLVTGWKDDSTPQWKLG